MSILVNWLLPPKEEVLAREFCDIIYDVGLKEDEKIVVLSIKKYFAQLYEERNSKLANAIKEELKRRNPRLHDKLLSD